MILQTKVCAANIKQNCRWHYIFRNTFFVIHFLVSIADCGYVHFFCSYLSKNEASFGLKFLEMCVCVNIMRTLD